MSGPKLSIEDFYHQFPNLDKHDLAGDHSVPISDAKTRAFKGKPVSVKKLAEDIAKSKTKKR